MQKYTMMNTMWCLLICSPIVRFISSLQNEEPWHVVVNFSLYFYIPLKEICICLLYMVGKQLPFVEIFYHVV